jgi:dTDP-4-dehydrorhamnose reductase
MLITGAAGFLGRHLIEASEIAEWELLTPSSTVLDIRSEPRVLDEISTWRPNVVVHLAYRKGDRRNIVDGSRHVAAAAAGADARLIHVSTDVVFGGRPQPYTEADPLDPIIDYGRDKAEAEAEVARAYPAALIVRPSLLYGTDRLGHCQTDVERAVGGMSNMAFFTDEWRCPVHAADVAAAITALADRPEVTGPLHVAGPEPISRSDFAVRIAQHLRLDPAKVPTASIADSGQLRPGVVLLDSSRAISLDLRMRSIDEAFSR